MPGDDGAELLGEDFDLILTGGQGRGAKRSLKVKSLM